MKTCLPWIQIIHLSILKLVQFNQCGSSIAVTAGQTPDPISSNDINRISTRPRQKRNVGQIFSLNIGSSSEKFVVGPTFLSLALGGTKVGRFCELVSSQTAKNIARVLSPADLRIGGTISHQVTFDPSVTKCNTVMEKLPFNKNYKGPYPNLPQFGLTGPQMVALNTFLTEMNWGLLYNLNVFKFRPDGLWDSTNVEQLLNYTSAAGVRISSFHLGNEPMSYRSHFNYTEDPKVLTKDYKILKQVLLKYPLYAGSKLFGPDLTDLRKVKNVEILKKFLSSGADQIIDGVSLHHYYCDGDVAKASAFFNVTSMEGFRSSLEKGRQVIKETSSRPLPIHLTETSNCYGGGAKGYSDRYIAGFLWLDKLGVSASSGVIRVFRQTLFSSSYALVNEDMSVPFPDYYLSVLYKMLVRGPVLELKMSPPDPKLRIYANCAHDLWYKGGAVVVYYLNLDTSVKTITIPQAKGGDVDVFILTPGEGSNLTSQTVKLNGELFQSSPSGEFPPVVPLHTNKDLKLPAQTFGFVVLPDVQEPTCMDYFQKIPSLHSKFHFPLSEGRCMIESSGPAVIVENSWQFICVVSLFLFLGLVGL